MNRTPIDVSHSMPVQPAYLIGTFHEDGTPDFAPITWVSRTCAENDEYLVIISMYGTKKTKLNVQRTGQFTMNLINTALLTLTDYFGQTSGKSGVKDALPYEWSRAHCVDAPTLDASPLVCECEVVQTVTTGPSDTFFCRVHRVEADARADVAGFGVDLTQFDPVIYSGHYHSLGEHLGRIGDFYKKPQA